MIGFRTALFCIFFVFFVNVVALYLDWYRVWEWLDVPMHFFGGYTVALLGMVLYRWIGERVDIHARSHPQSMYAMLLLEGLVVVGFAMIIGVAWEIWEFLMDQFATAFVQRFGASQPGIADTMDDLFNDGIGAVTAWLLWRNKA